LPFAAIHLLLRAISQGPRQPRALAIERASVDGGKPDRCDAVRYRSPVRVVMLAAVTVMR
jgi:hypothetical protein